MRQRFLVPFLLGPLAGPALAADTPSVCSFDFWDQDQATITATLPKADLTCSDERGRGAVLWAVREGGVEDIRAVIAAGAPIDAVDSYGNTPLLWLGDQLIENSLELLAAGADPMARTPEGQTPLHIAALKTPELIGPLLAKGAEIEAQDGIGCTPLVYAARADDAQALTILLSEGAVADVRCGNGDTPLFSAATAETSDNIAALVKAGVDVTAVNDLGMTPLHQATMMSLYPENIVALFAAGVDGSVRDKRGKTAWDYAKDRDDITGEARRLLQAAAGE